MQKTSTYAFIVLMSSSVCFAQFPTGELKSLESMIKNATVQNQMASPKDKEKPVANVMAGTYLATYNGVKSKSDFVQIKSVQDGGLSAYIEVTAEGTPPGWLELEFKRHGNAYKFSSNEASDIGSCEIELIFVNSTAIKLSQSNNSCGLAARQQLTGDYTYEKNYTTAVTAKDQEKIDSEKAAALSKSKRSTSAPIGNAVAPIANNAQVALSSKDISDIQKNSDKPRFLLKYKSRLLVVPVVVDKKYGYLDSNIGQMMCDGDISIKGAIKGRKYTLTGTLIEPIYQDDDGGKFFSMTNCSIK